MSRTLSTAAPVAQLAEADGLKPLWCGFESHRGHQSVSRVTGCATPDRRPAAVRLMIVRRTSRAISCTRTITRYAVGVLPTAAAPT